MKNKYSRIYRYLDYGLLSIAVLAFILYYFTVMDMLPKNVIDIALYSLFSLALIGVVITVVLAIKTKRNKLDIQ